MTPVFGTAAVLVAPSAPLLASGYVAGNSLAAQHYNWMWYHMTKELNNLLAFANLSQNTGDDTQVTQAVQFIAGREKYTPTAGYTPALGDVVQLNYDGTISNAKRIVSAAFDASNTIASAGGIALAPIDNSHVLVMWAVGLVIKAQIYTIDPYGINSPSALNSPATVFTCTTTLSGFDVAYSYTASGTAYLLMGYHLTGGAATTTTAVVASVNLSTYTMTINTPVNSATTGQWITFYSIAGTQNVLAAFMSSTTVITCQVISLVTVTPTWNTAATLTGANAFSIGSNITKIGLGLTPDGTQAFISMIDGTVFTAVHGQMAISGTGLTATAMASTGVPCFVGASNPKPDSATNTGASLLMAYAYGASGTPPIEMVIFNIRKKSSSAAVSIGRSPCFGRQISQSTSEHSFRITDKASGVGFFCTGHADFSTGAGTYSSVFSIVKKTGLIMDASFVGGDPFQYNPGVGTGAGVLGGCMLPSGIFIFATSSTATTSGGTIYALRRRNTILGVAIDNAGTVQRSGPLTGLSGLTIGPVGVDDNGNLTSVVGEARIGQALSATVLDLQVIPGV